MTRVFKRIKLRRTSDGGMVAVMETTPAALIALVSGSDSALDRNAGSGGTLWYFQTQRKNWLSALAVFISTAKNGAGPGPMHAPCRHGWYCNAATTF
jgi:hypothetical protein